MSLLDELTDEDRALVRRRKQPEWEGADAGDPHRGTFLRSGLDLRTEARRATLLDLPRGWKRPPDVKEPSLDRRPLPGAGRPSRGPLPGGSHRGRRDRRVRRQANQLLQAPTKDARPRRG